MLVSLKATRWRTELLLSASGEEVCRHPLVGGGRSARYNERPCSGTRNAVFPDRGCNERALAPTLSCPSLFFSKHFRTDGGNDLKRACLHQKVSWLFNFPYLNHLDAFLHFAPSFHFRLSSLKTNLVFNFDRRKSSYESSFFPSY